MRAGRATRLALLSALLVSTACQPRTAVDAPGRPLLAPLVGPKMWEDETRAVEAELVASLAPENRAVVEKIPLVIDHDQSDPTAFAVCDDRGRPAVVVTESLLEALDAIAQTRATDELFGASTYPAYATRVAPKVVEGTGSPKLRAGIVPLQYWGDARRLSRAHEMFDEMIGFTLAHELSHHYLGHTSCAHGQTPGISPDWMELGRMLSAAVPLFNQPNELAADASGCMNLLDAGRLRSAHAYPWTEEGGVFVLDFFFRVEQVAGDSPTLAFFRTHPDPALRIPILLRVAGVWRQSHGG